MTDSPLISVVIPVYKSEKILPDLCFELSKALDQRSFEVILVVDCSPDNSWPVAQKISENDQRFIAIDLRINAGQDRAIMAGLNYSTGEFVVIMDDDLQHDPQDIEALLTTIQQGADVVYANFLRKKQTRFKNLMSWGAGIVAQKVLAKPAHIYLSPFKIIRKDVVKEITNYKGPFPYVDGLIFQVTSHIDQITVTHHHRKQGETTHNFWKQASLFLTLATNFSILPLRIMTLSGFIIALGSFLLGLYFYVLYLIKGITVVGWTAIILINLFIGGSLMTTLGVIGEYVGRILMNVNQSPQYIIKNISRLTGDDHHNNDRE